MEDVIEISFDRRQKFYSIVFMKNTVILSLAKALHLTCSLQKPSAFLLPLTREFGNHGNPLHGIQDTHI